MTGWNEWIAGHWQGIPERPVMFVDCANYEYSRDIEMMRGGYFDNYLMQLIGYVRRYKGMEAIPSRKSGEVAVFDGFADGGMPRDAEGYGGIRYVNRTGRNVITRVTVRHDAQKLFFALETLDPITPCDGTGAWMRLYLNVRGGQGYDRVICPRADGSGQAEICRVIGEGDALDAQPQEGAYAACAVQGKRMCLTVPRDAVGLADAPFTLWFKAADSREDYRTVADFYESGNAVPLGRLNFVYRGV